MTSAPGASGVLTFLCTDIEGSTRRWETDPAAMATALASHDATMEREVNGAGGALFKHTGDGCLAVFGEPEQGIAAAVGIQRAFTGAPLAVRVALHSGVADQRAGDYFGPTLNRAARLLGAGHGRQILVSDQTASLTRLALVDGVTLVDLGEHRLRDLPEPQRIHQVVADGLEREFPPLRSERRTLGTLPVPRTSLVGRAQALDDLVPLVREHPIVTLTGVGGTGKTRLAIAVAARLADELADGACFADLAPVAEDDAVPRAVAEAVGMPLVAGQQVDADLGRYLAGSEAVLVLDNCEHVLDGAADLVDLLVERAPALRILATSREALGVAGEHHWRVPSLATDLPAPGASSPAAALFVERAEAAGVTLDLTAGRDDVDEIVRRLDGIPLAIELAAARTPHLAPRQILGMLDDRFSLLGGGRRRARQRQVTLQAAVDWSYDLLDDQERAVLRRLGVFSGPFTIDAAIAVCGRGEPGADTLAVLTALVDKSLVVAAADAQGMRYRLLETIRLYALDKLAAAGEGAECRDRHRDHYLAWSEGLSPAMPSPTDLQRVLEPEADNIRAAIDWSFEQDRPDLVVRQASAAALCWFQSLRSDEADAWLAATAARADPLLDLDARLAWRGARLLFATERSDIAGVTRWMAEVDTLGEGVESQWVTVVATLRPLLVSYLQPDEVEANLALLERARAHPRNRALRWSVSVLGYVEAHILLSGGRDAEALEVVLRTRADPEGEPYWRLLSGAQLLVTRHLLGDDDTAVAEVDALLDEVPDVPGRYGDLVMASAASVALAGAGARERARRLLQAQLETIDRRYAHIATAPGIPLVNAAVLLALDGAPEEATRVLGALGRLVMHMRAETSFCLFRAYSERLHGELGDAVFLRCLDESEAMTVRELVHTARAVAAGAEP